MFGSNGFLTGWLVLAVSGQEHRNLRRLHSEQIGLVSSHFLARTLQTLQPRFEYSLGRVAMLKMLGAAYSSSLSLICYSVASVLRYRGHVFLTCMLDSLFSIVRQFALM